MDVSRRDYSNPFICKIIFIDSAELVPAAGDDFMQNFFDSYLENPSLSQIYNSIGKVKFSEKGEETKAGILYTQTLQFQFPNGDAKKASRINTIIEKLKFAAIGLTNDRYILIGRNDWYQNTRPKIKIETNQKVTGFRITSSSIFSSGYTNLSGQNVFPYQIPNT